MDDRNLRVLEIEIEKAKLEKKHNVYREPKEAPWLIGIATVIAASAVIGWVLGL